MATSLPAQALEALHAGLDALGKAIGADELDLAEQLLSEHDRQVRDYVEHSDTPPSAQTLQHLLDRQLAVGEDLRQRREVVASAWQQSRKAARATHAYEQAESLT